MTNDISVWTYCWMFFMILCFLTLGFALGWNARGIKEIDNRFKKTDESLNEQIKQYEEGMEKCSQIFLKYDSQHCGIPCETDAAATTEIENT